MADWRSGKAVEDAYKRYAEYLLGPSRVEENASSLMAQHLADLLQASGGAEKEFALNTIQCVIEHDGTDPFDKITDEDAKHFNEMLGIGKD